MVIRGANMDKRYNNLIIASNGRTIGSIRNPMFCILNGKYYDSTHAITWEESYNYLHNNTSGTIVVLDSFDLSYQGYIDFDDIASYERDNDLEWNGLY